MKAFTYERPTTVQDAAKLAAERPNASSSRAAPICST